ncbi:MAG: PspC domain-containing protein [Halanaerobiales bacterium]|nr:PspC domain-containing protein [Halanaerobiales bacterium]
MEKKLYRSRENRVIGGVCGGIGEYFGIDPVIARIILLLLFFVGGIGFITYIIALIIIPERPFEKENIEVDETEIKEQKEKRMKILGYILFGLGVYFILNIWFNINIEFGAELWSIGLIILGILIIFKNKS